MPPSRERATAARRPNRAAESDEAGSEKTPQGRTARGQGSAGGRSKGAGAGAGTPGAGASRGRRQGRSGSDGAQPGRAPARDVRLVDQTGRPLGPRAVATRRRVLEATEALLAERPVREVSVVEIARRAGTSPATFYQYFKDVEEATLDLAREAAEEVPAVLEPLRADWNGTGGLDAARALVDAFVRHWDDHHAVLLFRNVGAEQGDRRFRRVRIQAIHPLIEALAAKVGEARSAGRVSEQVQPVAAAAALASILERLAAYHQELEILGVGRPELVETCARILHQTVTGRTPS